MSTTTTLSCWRWRRLFIDRYDDAFSPWRWCYVWWYGPRVEWNVRVAYRRNPKALDWREE